MGLLEEGAPSLQAGAAYVLGTAASNNEKLTSVLVKEHPQLLQQLLKVSMLFGWRVHCSVSCADAWVGISRVSCHV